jgi:NAD(P)-dependent dehydrogenase (short-subunit alcohol dehydrogenase family)
MRAGVLKNKVIVVTGGAGLLGDYFVRDIAKRDGIVVVADIDFEAAKSVAKKCKGNAEAVYLDITSKDSVRIVIDALLNKYGRIDALVNNAYPRNSNYGKKLEDVDYSDFCENVNMHLGGYFIVAQQFCLAFKKQGYGNIINMSSIYGSMTPRFGIYDGTSMTMPVEYAAIKSAVEHMTRYFAQYFKGTGIRVNSLSPGGILAEQPSNFLVAYNKHCASKGMLDATDLIGTLIFLLTDQSRFITGQNLIVDDGYSL